MESTSRSLPMGADLYGDLAPPDRRTWRDFPAGLIVVAAGTAAAGFLSDRYGAPLTLMALLIGLSLNFLSADARIDAGTGFAARHFLRWGIVLAGVRITFAQVQDLGPVALMAVIVIVALTIGAGIVAAWRLGQGSAFGVLAGGAVAICGASAAMALAATLGERRVGKGQLALVLVGISAMSATAMVLYPIVAHGLGLSDAKAGFILGASIHDVAQALGAGYAYSQPAGDTATIVKLSRVALLAPVLMVVALFLPRAPGAKGVGVPWFVIGFFAVAGVNSLGLIPASVATLAETLATAGLAAAVTAVAIRSPLRELLEAGWRPLLVILAATLTAFALAVTAALTLIR